LLSDLLGFDSLGEFLRDCQHHIPRTTDELYLSETQVGNRDILELEVELSSALQEIFTNS